MKKQQPITGHDFNIHERAASVGAQRGIAALIEALIARSAVLLPRGASARKRAFSHVSFSLFCF